MLSQTTEYALRAMACLAYQPGQLTPTPKLHEQTQVPSNYLAKVLQSLAQAKLIIGRRGVGGGYRLARPAADVTLLDVVNAIDPINRIEQCPLGLPNHEGTLCALHQCLDEAAKKVIDLFQGKSLADLVIEAQGARPLCDAEMTERLADFDRALAGQVATNGNGNGSMNGHAAHSHGNGNGNGNGNGHHTQSEAKPRITINGERAHN